MRALPGRPAPDPSPPDLACPGPSLPLPARPGPPGSGGRCPRFKTRPGHRPPAFGLVPSPGPARPLTCGVRGYAEFDSFPVRTPEASRLSDSFLPKRPAVPRIGIIRIDSESGSQLSQVYGGGETPALPGTCAKVRIELCVAAHRTLRGGVSRSAPVRTPGAADSARNRTGLGAAPERRARIELCAAPRGRGRIGLCAGIS